MNNSESDVLHYARTGVWPKPWRGNHWIVGRDEEIFRLEQIFECSRYAVIRGRIGEGKSHLAYELAHRMVHSGRVTRFVHVHMGGDIGVDGMLRGLCRRLFGIGTPLLASDDTTELFKAVATALAERPTLIELEDEVGYLPPDFPSPAFANAMLAQCRHERQESMAVMERLLEVKGTRLLITCREPMTGLLCNPDCSIDLGSLAPNDAIRVLSKWSACCRAEKSKNGSTKIAELAASADFHAGTLHELGNRQSPSLNYLLKWWLKTKHRMLGLFPDSEEPFFMCRAPLHRMLKKDWHDHPNRLLGMFYQGADLKLLTRLSDWKSDEIQDRIRELSEMGMSPLRLCGGGHIRDHGSSLFQIIRAGLSENERGVFLPLWLEGMHEVLLQIKASADDPQSAGAALRHLRWELPNLLAALHFFYQQENHDYANTYGELLASLVATTDLDHVKNAIADFSTALIEPTLSDLP